MDPDLIVTRHATDVRLIYAVVYVDRHGLRDDDMRAWTVTSAAASPDEALAAAVGADRGRRLAVEETVWLSGGIGERPLLSRWIAVEMVPGEWDLDEDAGGVGS